MKIVFVRHGESVDDLEDRYGGWTDFELTDKGKSQLTETAKKISSLNQEFEIVLSSPLKRAFQAAEIIANKLDLPLEVFEFLKERNLSGMLTGLVRSEAKEKYPDLVVTHNRWEYVHGSERAEDFNSRVRNAIRYVLKMKYDSVIAVTHGLFITVFYKEMLDLDILKVDDGGFVLVEVEGGKFKILKEDGIFYEQ